MPKFLLTLALLTVLAVTGCGDKGDEEASGSSGLCATATAAPASAVTLPQGFPQESTVTMVATTTAGPTSVTAGTSTAGLDAVFKAYKADLAKAPYGVTKSEKDEHDAEVNFASADTTGQVKLQECSGGKVAVQVTARPR